MKINRTVQFLVRLFIAIIILGITAFFTPGFELNNLVVLAIAVCILTFVDFFIGNFTRLFYHPYMKLIIGFVLACLALYYVQYFLIGYTLSLIPIVLGAIVYGLVDYMLPNEEDKSKTKQEQPA